MPWNFPSPLVTLRFYLFRRPICGEFPVVLKGLVISSLLSIWIKSNEILKLTLYLLIAFISPIPMVSFDLKIIRCEFIHI